MKKSLLFLTLALASAGISQAAVGDTVAAFLNEADGDTHSTGGWIIDNVAGTPDNEGLKYRNGHGTAMLDYNLPSLEGDYSNTVDGWAFHEVTLPATPTTFNLEFNVWATKNATIDVEICFLTEAVRPASTPASAVKVQAVNNRPDHYGDGKDFPAKEITPGISGPCYIAVHVVGNMRHSTPGFAMQSIIVKEGQSSGEQPQVDVDFTSALTLSGDKNDQQEWTSVSGASLQFAATESANTEAITLVGTATVQSRASEADPWADASSTTVTATAAGTNSWSLAFDPAVAAEGSYRLHIPAGAFAVEGKWSCEEINEPFAIAAAAEPEPPTPSSAINHEVTIMGTSADDDAYAEISGLRLAFTATGIYEGYTLSQADGLTVALQTRATASDDWSAVTTTQAILAADAASANVWDVTLDPTPLTQEGEYRFLFPAGTFVIADIDPELPALWSSQEIEAPFSIVAETEPDQPEEPFTPVEIYYNFTDEAAPSWTLIDGNNDVAGGAKNFNTPMFSKYQDYFYTTPDTWAAGLSNTYPNAFHWRGKADSLTHDQDDWAVRNDAIDIEEGATYNLHFSYVYYQGCPAFTIGLMDEVPATAPAANAAMHAASHQGVQTIATVADPVTTATSTMMYNTNHCASIDQTFSGATAKHLAIHVYGPVQGDDAHVNSEMMISDIKVTKTANPTGVENVAAEPAADAPFAIYDLQGRLVRPSATTFEGLPTGLYIGAGRKVMVK